MAECRKETALFRAKTVNIIRHFFAQRDVLEVDTPLLCHTVTTDCNLDHFSSRFHPSGWKDSEQSEEVFLHTSPELHMKRLLAAGFPDIYQICKVFRNGERGRLHNPEFTMVEWYRRSFTMMDLVDEVAALCSEILGEKKVQKKSYQSLFIEILDIDPLTASPDQLLSLCTKKGLCPPYNDTVSDLLMYLMTYCIEPCLPKDTFTFVYDYPSDQAVLAALNPEDPRVSSRFELYYQGIELCNGFEELTDWQENKKRMHTENEKRKKAGKPLLPIDNHFIGALAAGMPPCSGVALGLDRVIMLAAGKDSLDTILTESWENS